MRFKMFKESDVVLSSMINAVSLIAYSFARMGNCIQGHAAS